MANMKYRPEIDGLRAVAVLPVILSHAGVPCLPAGFLGVDVFFVISGFLITSILLGELEAGKFSFVRFYERRARRILPPLGFMLLLAVPVAWGVMLPSQLKDFGQSIVATVGFAANFYFWLTKDYWADAAEITPLLHLWSLGVEEQFYFLFPPVLALTYRYRRALPAILSILLVASLVAMVYARARGHNATAFYLLPYRSWELLAGALSGVISTRRTKALGNNDWWTWLLLVALLGSYALFTPLTDPLLLYGIPVAATSLILLNCTQWSPVGRLLSTPVLTWVGRLSYSLYLFHQPVLAFMRLRFGLDLTPLAIAGSLCMTLLLSWGSYSWVEQPCRRVQTISMRTLGLSLAAVGCILVAFGWTARSTRGFWEAKVAQMTPAGRKSLKALWEAASERSVLWKKLLAEARQDFQPNAGDRVLFVGDSLSEDLFVAASLAPCTALPLQFRQIYLDNECVVSQSPGRTGFGGVPCATEMRRFRESSLLRESDCLVIAAAWLETATSLPNLLDLPELRGKAVLIYETHGFTDIGSLIMFMDRSGLTPDSQQFREYVFMSRHDRTEKANSILSQIATSRGLEAYRGFACFCGHAEAMCDVFDEHGQPLIIDQAHLTIYGAERIGPSLCDTIRKAIGQNAHAR
jgi:peptidoglycan/LPS O-acetylase OafA/YrhL